MCKYDRLVVLGFNATLTAKVILWRICVSWLSHTSTNTTFLSKATDYFSHMLKYDRIIDFVCEWVTNIVAKVKNAEYQFSDYFFFFRFF